MDPGHNFVFPTLAATSRGGVPMSYGDDSGYQGGGRLPIGRLIGALVIAPIGVVVYMSQTQVNPVTGEKQHVAMSVDQEMALGLQAAPEMASKMGGDVDPAEDPRAALVEEVGRRLVRNSDASKSPYVENFHFHLLRDPKTVNAFACPVARSSSPRGCSTASRTRRSSPGCSATRSGT